MQMHHQFDLVDQRFQDQMNLMESRLDAYSFQPFSTPTPTPTPTPPPPQPSPPPVPDVPTSTPFVEDVHAIPDVPPA